MFIILRKGSRGRVHKKFAQFGSDILRRLYWGFYYPTRLSQGEGPFKKSRSERRHLGEGTLYLKIVELVSEMH
jgi:hypothetical protein